MWFGASKEICIPDSQILVYESTDLWTNPWRSGSLSRRVLRETGSLSGVQGVQGSPISGLSRGCGEKIVRVLWNTSLKLQLLETVRTSTSSGERSNKEMAIDPNKRRTTLILAGTSHKVEIRKLARGSTRNLLDLKPQALKTFKSQLPANPTCRVMGLS